MSDLNPSRPLNYTEQTAEKVDSKMVFVAPASRR